MSHIEMSRRYIDEHHLIERYLSDQLDEAERAAFESYYVAHPEILEELQAAAGMVLGLQQLQASGKLQQALAPATAWRRGLALAACLLLMICASLWLRQRPVPAIVAAAQAAQLADRDGRPLPLGPAYDIERTRATFDAIVTLPALPQAIALRVRIEVAAPSAVYQVALSTLDSKRSRREVALVRGLKPAADEFIEVFVSSQHLPAGVYELDLRVDEATTDSPAAQSVLINVVREGAGFD